MSNRSFLRLPVVCILSQLYFYFILCRPTLACPVRCDCEVKGEVNCTDVNLEGLPSSDLPSNIHFLYLGSNFISSVNEDDFQDLSDLKQLHLARNRISQLQTSAFRPLQILQVLDLRFNRINQIPDDAFTGLVSLIELNLGGNGIGSISRDAFAEMQSLEVLNLSDSNLRVSGLPAGLFQGARNLKWLDIEGSELRRVPNGMFEHLSNLTYLDLSWNRGIDLDMPSLFSSLRSMQTLIMEGCELSFLEPWSFAGLTSMIDLQLSFNALQEALPLALFEKTPHLRRIRLSNNSLTHLHERLFDSIDNLQYLEVLNNPWHCGCGLLGLRARWSYQLPVFFQRGLVCQSPEPFHGRDLWSLPLHELYDFCASGIKEMSTITLRGKGEGLQSLDCPVHAGTNIAWFTPNNEYITTHNVAIGNDPNQQNLSHRLLANGTLLVDSIQLGTYVCTVTLSDGSYIVGGVQVDIVPLKSPGPPQINNQSNLHFLLAFAVLIILGIVALAAWVAYRIRRRYSRRRYDSLSKEHALIEMRPPAQIHPEQTDYDYDYAYAHPRARLDLTSHESPYAVGGLCEERRLNVGRSLVPRCRPISRSMHERGPRYYNDCVRAALPRTSHTISTGEVNGYITPSQITAYTMSVRSWKSQGQDLTSRVGKFQNPNCNCVSLSPPNISRPDSSDHRYLEIV
ncbi:leucine-rich repeat transmembrane neuronal protein 1-like [Patiria miniata]|uniref:Uncharacterized protein n=1 Tax=Patiria miniata TaxID=46514 RepID=A0A914AAF7_PATMI|nr:leucine-rich repeat transmembrane neuronal protein 1-like [Patiria miniata]